jgi:hypothetical protein
MHHLGCRTKALNLIWFRGAGDWGEGVSGWKLDQAEERKDSHESEEAFF